MQFQTKDQATAFLKKIGALNKHRCITGAERQQVEVMLQMLPYTDSNNQRFWCRSWTVGNITYNHYSGSGLDDLEEVTQDNE